MTDTSTATSEGASSPPPGSTPSEMFPALTSAQQARVLAHGRRRTVEPNEIVVELNEHATKFFVVGGQPHVSIATLPGMWERTITVNSFSKSWSISGWRLGYVYGDAHLVSPLNKANNLFNVCSPTPLQRALSEVVMSDPRYYTQLRETFAAKRKFSVQALEQVGFEIYDSGSSFYVWARIPKGFEDAMQLNEMLIDRAQVAGVPGSAFADSNDWNNYMRLCIAREDGVLQGAFAKMHGALGQHLS